MRLTFVNLLSRRYFFHEMPPTTLLALPSPVFFSPCLRMVVLPLWGPCLVSFRHMCLEASSVGTSR